MTAIEIVSRSLAVVLFVEHLHLSFRGWIYYSDQGILNQKSYNQTLGRSRPSVFFLLSSPKKVHFFFLVSSICLLALIIRPDWWVLWLMVQVSFLSRINRNPFVSSHGDRLALFGSVFFIFMGLGLPETWVEFGIRFLCSIVYIYTGINKLINPGWNSGIAIFQCLWDSFPRRNSIPYPKIFDNFGVSFLVSWITIILQIFIGIGIWIPELRVVCLFFAIGLHIGIELFFNLKAFQFVILSLMLVNLNIEKLVVFIENLIRFSFQLN